ncbi:MAG TPA: hypothetical protein EYQ82_05170 [Dehalococcoidia bacterium]|jgi:regulator of protease activity HflC (stomatin/prohibitin superfamily)|nr:hypothetical protein [Dehalococcoidia bacterium]HIK98915.1 hypothetical protein [Dehalococcoidia bacterium]
MNGDRQTEILASGGARQASILRAEGFAEALKSLEEGESSKPIFPIEFTKFPGPIGAMFGANGSAEVDGYTGIPRVSIYKASPTPVEAFTRLDVCDGPV